MRKIINIFIFTFAVFFATASLCFAGFAYQDFELGNGSSNYGYSWNGEVRLSQAGEPVHSGASSWRVNGTVQWLGMAVLSQVSGEYVDFKADKNDRLAFWIYSLPQTEGNNNVGVKFFDNNIYKDSGFEVWTTKTAFYDKWTQLNVLFSQLPDDFNLQQIKRVEFVSYWPGTYYYDDIQVIRQDRVYQAFEIEQRQGSTAGDCGWRWNGDDTVDVSQEDEPVYEGLHSWKLISTQKWGGTGIQSQEQKYVTGEGQSFWHVDLHPEKNDSLIFWVYALPSNGMDNNLAVQFYDWGEHFTDDTKAVAWTKETAKYGKWTQMTVLFSELPSTLNLRDINKIQFQQYWPGTYYIDDIKATSPILTISPVLLPEGIIKWEKNLEAAKYTLQENTAGLNGPWTTVYAGTNNSFATSRLTKTWYRVKWQEASSATDSIPYISNWSNITQYTPPPIFIIENSLRQGCLEWRQIPQADLYEVRRSYNENGPWFLAYKGRYPRFHLRAYPNRYYKVRALSLNGRAAIYTSKWSRPQGYFPGYDFLQADGTTIIKQKITGEEEIALKGVNLGSLFLIEKWMTGIGAADEPNIEDDWTIRSVLADRFGRIGCEILLRKYQNAYIKAADFDNLANIGINFVRLPIYYYDIDFSRIDRVVNACANRGIYVLLDLHGAPGSQSNEAHTGRQNYNKLFEDSLQGAIYRARTVILWKEIARRYKDNPAVCGYDLLNEPIGAPTREILWQLYDRIYDAIRKVDNRHIVVMEGIWDWDTLPKPSDMRWENVVYQFHYYLWDHDEDVEAHKAYIDDKIAQSNIYQAQYNVPVMIGEFHCFNQRPIWEYYLQKFNEQKWPWSMWSYKTHQAPSEWGLYNHTYYNDDPPKLREDSFCTLVEKFDKYDTLGHHTQNVSLSELIEDNL